MSLYVRVMIGFFTHRKTMRLKSKIGDAAYWVPPRLWAYAAENQPDGCFKDYSPPELAMLLGYLGDPQALLQALLQAGFMDDNPLRIHDWAEHNGYHDFYAERARKAANVRWSKKGAGNNSGNDMKGHERKGKEKSQALLQASKCTQVVVNSASPPSSNHEAFITGWTQNFTAKFGFAYVFEGGRDGKAVKDLLRTNILSIDLLEIAKQAWDRAGQSPKAFNCEQASTIHGFQNHLNQIRTELKNETHRTRNSGNSSASIPVKGSRPVGGF